MTPEQENEIKELREAASRSDTTVKRLQESLRISDAEKICTVKLVESGLPKPAQARLALSLPVNPPAKEDGTLDRDAFLARVTEAIKAEGEYLASITPGGVRGMGATSTEVKEVKVEDLTKQFVALGMSESAAKIAANGRS